MAVSNRTSLSTVSGPPPLASPLSCFVSTPVWVAVPIVVWTSPEDGTLGDVESPGNWSPVTAEGGSPGNWSPTTTEGESPGNWSPTMTAEGESQGNWSPTTTAVSG